MDMNPSGDKSTDTIGDIPLNSPPELRIGDEGENDAGATGLPNTKAEKPMKQRLSDNKLSLILKDHEKWLSTKGKDGRKANLTSADLRGRILIKINLNNADLGKINLKGADLSGAEMKGANLKGANLSETRLNEVYLSGADLTNADLSKSNLTVADLSDTNLTSANLREANLSDAGLNRSNLSNANLSNANLKNAGFSKAKLNHTDLSNANLEGTILNGIDLSSTRGLTLEQLRLAKTNDNTILPSYLKFTAPTPKTHSDLWTKEDALGYEAYAKAIARVITHATTTPPLTVGIKAPWGAGKTSLMKNVQHMLDNMAYVTEENEAGKHSFASDTVLKIRDIFRFIKKPVKLDRFRLKPVQSPKGRAFGIQPRATVWFNVWKYNTSEQIWAGLAHSIITQVTARMKPIDRERFWLNLHVRRIDSNKVRSKFHEMFFWKALVPGLVCSLLVAVALVTPFMKDALKHFPIILDWINKYVLPTSGADWLKKHPLEASGTGGFALGFLRYFRLKLTKVDGVFKEYVRAPDYDGTLGFLHLVDSDLKAVLDLVATKEQPLVIFVDDLDRCSPCKVAEVVEAINLFLSGDYPQCVFVLGMDPTIVSAALEVANKDIIQKIGENSVIGNHEHLGWRFMEKIVQLSISVPPPTESGIDSYLDKLVGPKSSVSVDKGTESGGLAQNLSSSVSSASAPLQENGASKEKTMSTRIFQAIREVKNEAIQVFLRVFKGEMEDARENAQSPEEAVILEKFAQTASHYMEKLEGAKTSTEVSQRVDELLDEQKDDTAIDRKAIIEAGARMYSEKFEKNEPLLRDFVDKYKGYFHENPRQIKRIINMIRFLCIARYYVEKELRGDGLGKIEDLPPDGAIFKFVAVTTLWPLATDYMKKNYKLADGREVSIFSLMEDVARDLKDKAAADVTWADFLASKNISDKWGVSSPEFRGLLAEGAGISRYVGRGLW